MPNVLIADDGELLRIREMLSELGVPYHDGSEGRDRAPLDLLVTNPRQALSNRTPARFHLVVYEDASNTLRRALERSTCDLALQSPLDSAVFRMIVDRALYSGPERRGTQRAVLWADVTVKMGRKQTHATLGQLSINGCSLLLDRAPEEGSGLGLTLPKEVTGAKPMLLKGRVLRSTRVAAEQGSVKTSVKFQPMPRKDARQLERIVRQHAGRELDRPPTTAKEGVTERPLGVDRRKNPRASFESQVLASGAEGSQVLLGCDLSIGGMRVRPEPSLAVDDELKIALYARMGLPSVMVKAVVVRKEPDGHLGLRFASVSNTVATRLEQMIAALPPLVDSPRAKPGVIVSEILERLGPEDDSA